MYVGPDVGDASIGCQIHCKKCSIVSMMAHVLETCDLVTYDDTQGFPEWENLMSAEIDSQLKNYNWDLVPQPLENNTVKFYNAKFTSEGVVEHHKVHLVSKGFSWQEGIDYIEIFSLVSKMNSI